MTGVQTCALPIYGVSGAAPGTYTDNGGTIIVDGDGSSAWIYNENQVISIKTFGAIGDGVTDDTAAFRAAWDAASALAVPDLYIPVGTYSLNSTTASFNLVEGMTVRGDGLYDSIIIWSNDLTGPTYLIGRINNAPTVENINLKDFCVMGTHGDNGNYSQISKYPILVYHVNNEIGRAHV